MKFYKNILKIGLYYAISCLVTLQINAQSKEAKEGYISFKAPSSNFIDVEIEAHKGLPRFGDLLFSKLNKELSTQNAFEELVKMKYMSAIYADINKNELSKSDRSQTADKKLKNSILAQRHLLKLLGLVGSEEVLEKYFCNDSDTKCSYAVGKYGMRPTPSYWGGVRNFNVDEFKQHRSYTSFTKKHLDELLNWSKTFFPNNELTAYYVSRAIIKGNYDFSKKGYIIFNKMNGKQFLHPSWFESTDENERKLKENSFNILFPIAPEKAKALKFQNMSRLYLVYKVKITASEDTNSKGLKLSFKLENRTVEVYKDNALTEKIGEIVVDTIVTEY